MIRRNQIKIIIGLVGKKLSGKETFVELLKNMCGSKPAITQLRSSDLIADILDLVDLPHSREHMQKLPIALINAFGNNVITNGMRKRIQEADGNIIIFDGVRRKTDAEMIKKMGGIIIYIDANTKTRFDRTRKRKEKVGENSVTWEKFLEQDQAEIELEIPEIGKLADCQLDNNGTLEKFHAQIQELYLNHIKYTG